MNALLFLVASFLAPHAPAQDPLFRPKDADKPAAAAIERLKEWPKLEGDALKTAKLDIERLRKCNTPEMGDQADAALTADGAAVAPDLLAVLGKERNLEARLRVETVLEKITGAVHTQLLAPYFTDKSRDVRRWSLHRCGLFPDPALKAPAEAAWKAVVAAREKDPKAEGIDDEHYAAALCTIASGSLIAIEPIASYAQTQWGRRGVELRAALEGVRNDEATAFAAKLTQDADRAKKVAGLNLLAGCGTKAALPAVRPLLDSNDNSIRIAAINAMRGIVDGDPPIANLPVFEAIELAKKWKERSH